MAHLVHPEDKGTGKSNGNRTVLLPLQRAELLKMANEVLPLIRWDGANENDAGLLEDLEGLEAQTN